MSVALIILVALLLTPFVMALAIRDRGWVEVKIAAGDHYPSLWTIFQVAALVGFFGTKLFSVRFWEGTDTPDITGTFGQSNKVLGRTHGLVGPRKGSTRLAWLGRGNGALTAWTMTERDSRPVFSDPKYLMVGQGVQHTVSGFGIPCVPYYGGDNAAPEDVALTIYLT